MQKRVKNFNNLLENNKIKLENQEQKQKKPDQCKTKSKPKY